MGIYRFGTSNLPLTYSFQELEQKISKMVTEMPSSFTFQQICGHVLQMADKEGRIQKAPSTEYSTIHLTSNDVQTISRILWNMIWEKKLFIVFDAYPIGIAGYDIMFAKC